MGPKSFAFIHRVAFICNIFFLGCLLMGYMHFALPQALVSVMLTLGWILSPIMNVIAFFFFMFTMLRSERSDFPGWIILVNVVMLFYQIFHFFIV